MDDYPPDRSADHATFGEDEEVQDLIESFKRMKIVDLPKFKPHHPGRSARSSGFKPPPPPLYEPNRFLDSRCDLTDDFLFKTVDFQPFSPSRLKPVLVSLANAQDRPERISDEKDAELDMIDRENEHGEFVDENDYPETTEEEDAEVYWRHNSPFLAAPSESEAMEEEEEERAMNDEEEAEPEFWS
jgi:hypothetical protein